MTTTNNDKVIKEAFMKVAQSGHNAVISTQNLSKFMQDFANNINKKKEDKT